MRLVPRIGWHAIPADEATALGLEQSGRWQWELFSIRWLGIGLSLRARAVPRVPRCPMCNDTGTLDSSYWAIDPCPCQGRRP